MQNIVSRSVSIKRKRHSWIWRARIWLDCVCATVSVKYGAKRLALFSTQISSPGLSHLEGKDVILAACDDVYFQDYAYSLAASLAALPEINHLHLHLLEPSAETISEAQELGGRYPNLAVTFTIDPCVAGDGLRYRNIYYNTARFVLASILLDHDVNRLLVIDIDSIANRPVWPVLDTIRDCSVAFSFRPHLRKPWQKILANAVFFDSTPLSKAFAARFARTVLMTIARGPRYHIDQIIPHYLGGIARRDERTRIGPIPVDVMSLDYSPDAAFWTAKGPAKHADDFLTRKAAVGQ